MQNARLEIVRQTKLDLAQWIAAGIGQCRHPATSQMLARYASAQLESAAMIPAQGDSRVRSHSLLREEIQRTGKGVDRDCVAILGRVSRAMLHVLAGHSQIERAEAVRDFTTAKVLRHELRAARILFDALQRKAAA